MCHYIKKKEEKAIDKTHYKSFSDFLGVLCFAHSLLRGDLLENDTYNLLVKMRQYLKDENTSSSVSSDLIAFSQKMVEKSKVVMTNS